MKRLILILVLGGCEITEGDVDVQPDKAIDGVCFLVESHTHAAYTVEVLGTFVNAAITAEVEQTIDMVYEDPNC